MRINTAIRLSFGLALACAAAGCSGGVPLTSPSKIFSTPDSFRSSKKPAGPHTVTEADLVTQDGLCPGEEAAPSAPAPSAEPGAETRGVGLEMTECQVVRRVGHPDRVEIGADPGGRRATVITYLQGPRSGIYHFVAGRLKQVERAPEPPAPAKPAKKRPKPKTATAN